MLKTWISVLLIAHIFGSTQAQSTEIDSLFSVLKNSTEKPDLASAHGRLAWLLMTRDINTAIAHIDTAATLFADLKDERNLAISKYRYAVILRNKGDYKNALDQIKGYQAYMVSVNDTFAMANGMFQIGVIHSQRGSYEDAITNYFEALKIYEKQSDSTGMGFTLNSIGIAYKNLGKYKEARAIYKQIIGIHSQRRDSIRLADALHNLGSVYQEEKKLDQALQYYHQAVDLDANYPKGLAINYADIGSVFLSKKDYKSALDFLNKAYQIQVENGYQTDLFLTLLNLGKVHSKLGEFRASENYFIRGLSLAENSKKLKRELFYALSELFKLQGNHKLALDNYMKYSAYNDSISEEKSLENINRLQIEYETAKKDKELSLKELQLQEQQNQILESEKQFNQAIGGVILLLLMTFGGWLYYRLRQRTKSNEIMALKAQQDVVRLESLIQGEERERVRLAQDLHDGINGDLAVIKYKITSLNSSGFKAKEKEAYSEAIGMLDNAVEQVRRISHNLAPPSLYNFDLLEAIKQYCAKVSSANPLNIGFQFYGDRLTLEKETETAIYRMVQELVNNVVKHASATEALVQINHRDQSLHMVVEDNGIGFNPDSKTRGIGLQNVRSRVNYLKGTLDIDSGGGGSTFTIEIDLKKTQSI